MDQSLTLTVRGLSNTNPPFVRETAVVRYCAPPLLKTMGPPSLQSVTMPHKILKTHQALKDTQRHSGPSKRLQDFIWSQKFFSLYKNNYKDQRYAKKSRRKFHDNRGRSS